MPCATHVILASGARETHLRTTRRYVASGRRRPNEPAIGSPIFTLQNSSPSSPPDPPGWDVSTKYAIFPYNRTSTSNPVVGEYTSKIASFPLQRDAACLSCCRGKYSLFRHPPPGTPRTPPGRQMALPDASQTPNGSPGRLQDAKWLSRTPPRRSGLRKVQFS